MKRAESLKNEIKIRLNLKQIENELEDYCKSDTYKQGILLSDTLKIINLIEFEVYKILSLHGKIDIDAEANLDIKPQYFKAPLTDIKNSLIELGYDVKNKQYTCDYGFPWYNYSYISINLKMFLQ